MALGAPLGVWALGRVDSRFLLPVLGGVIVAYALYALLSWRLPELTGRRWACGFGFVAGVLEGLFNFAGPPVIIYGQCRRWGPSEFKGNLQALFLLDHLIVITSRAIAGAYTATVLRNYLTSLPSLALGVGLIVARVIQPGVFRTLALRDTARRRGAPVLLTSRRPFYRSLVPGHGARAACQAQVCGGNWKSWCASA